MANVAYFSQKDYQTFLFFSKKEWTKNEIDGSFGILKDLVVALDDVIPADEAVFTKNEYQGQIYFALPKFRLNREDQLVLRLGKVDLPAEFISKGLYSVGKLAFRVTPRFDEKDQKLLKGFSFNTLISSHNEDLDCDVETELQIQIGLVDEPDMKAAFKAAQVGEVSDQFKRPSDGVFLPTMPFKFALPGVYEIDKVSRETIKCDRSAACPTGEFEKLSVSLKNTSTGEIVVVDGGHAPFTQSKNRVKMQPLLEAAENGERVYVYLKGCGQSQGKLTAIAMGQSATIPGESSQISLESFTAIARSQLSSKEVFSIEKTVDLYEEWKIAQTEKAQKRKAEKESNKALVAAGGIVTTEVSVPDSAQVNEEIPF